MSVVTLSTQKDVVYLPIDIIRANTYQPRKIFEQKALQELSDSIKQYGVLQPITVRLVKGYFYELIAGERRLRASKLAGLLSIPAIIMDITDKDSAVIAMIENLQRQDLNYIEEAEGYIKLMKEHNFTQDMLSKRVGKSQSTIANKIRILKLPDRVRNRLLANNLSERHARALLKLSDEEEQLKVLKSIVDNNLTVSKTEELIDKIVQFGHQQEKERRKQKKNKVVIKVKDVRIFANSIKQNIAFMEKSGYGVDYHVTESDEGYEFHIKLNIQQV